MLVEGKPLAALYPVVHWLVIWVDVGVRRRLSSIKSGYSLQFNLLISVKFGCTNKPTPTEQWVQQEKGSQTEYVGVVSSWLRC